MNGSSRALAGPSLEIPLGQRFLRVIRACAARPPRLTCATAFSCRLARVPVLSGCKHPCPLAAGFFPPPRRLASRDRRYAQRAPSLHRRLAVRPFPGAEAPVLGVASVADSLRAAGAVSRRDRERCLSAVVVSQAAFCGFGPVFGVASNASRSRMRRTSPTARSSDPNS